MSGDTNGRPRALSRAIAVLLIFCIVLAPVAAAGKQAEVRSEDYVRGRADGEKDARGSAVWILSGLFLGPFGLILPWISSPRAPATSFAGKSADYLEGYQDGYAAKARSRNFMYSFIGFGVWTAAAIGMTIALVRAAEGVSQGCGNALSEGCGNMMSGCTIPSPDLSCTAVVLP